MKVYVIYPSSFMTASLFVDFAKEIVDTVVKENNYRFLQLLQPSPELKCKLEGRDMWLGEDEDLSKNVPKICKEELFHHLKVALLQVLTFW